MQFVLCVLILIVACALPDTGISREKAENILRGFGLQDIDLSPTSDGWIGTADYEPNTYRLRAKVDRQGIMNLSPNESS